MRSSLLAATLIAASSSFTPTASADDGYPPPLGSVPPGYHLESRPQWGYIVISGIDLAVPYTFGLVAAADSHFDNHAGWLVVPALGPWLTLFTRTKSQESGGSDQVFSRDDFAVTALVVDGIFQAVGTAGLITFGTSPPKRLVPDSPVEAQFAPYVGPEGGGVRLTGRF